MSHTSPEKTLAFPFRVGCIHKVFAELVHDKQPIHVVFDCFDSHTGSMKETQAPLLDTDATLIQSLSQLAMKNNLNQFIRDLALGIRGAIPSSQTQEQIKASQGAFDLVFAQNIATNTVTYSLPQEMVHTFENPDDFAMQPEKMLQFRKKTIQAMASQGAEFVQLMFRLSSKFLRTASYPTHQGQHKMGLYRVVLYCDLHDQRFQPYYEQVYNVIGLRQTLNQNDSKLVPLVYLVMVFQDASSPHVDLYIKFEQDLAHEYSQYFEPLMRQLPNTDSFPYHPRNVPRSFWTLHFNDKGIEDLAARVVIQSYPDFFPPLDHNILEQIWRCESHLCFDYLATVKQIGKNMIQFLEMHRPTYRLDWMDLTDHDIRDYLTRTPFAFCNMLTPQDCELPLPLFVRHIFHAHFRGHHTTMTHTKDIVTYFIFSHDASLRKRYGALANRVFSTEPTKEMFPANEQITAAVYYLVLGQCLHAQKKVFQWTSKRNTKPSPWQILIERSYDLNSPLSAIANYTGLRRFIQHMDTTLFSFVGGYINQSGDQTCASNFRKLRVTLLRLGFLPSHTLGPDFKLFVQDANSPGLVDRINQQKQLETFIDPADSDPTFMKPAKTIVGKDTEEDIDINIGDYIHRSMDLVYLNPDDMDIQTPVGLRIQQMARLSLNEKDPEKQLRYTTMILASIHISNLSITNRLYNVEVLYWMYRIISEENIQSCWSSYEMWSIDSWAYQAFCPSWLLQYTDIKSPNVVDVPIHYHLDEYMDRQNRGQLQSTKSKELFERFYVETMRDQNKLSRYNYAYRVANAIAIGEAYKTANPNFDLDAYLTKIEYMANDSSPDLDKFRKITSELIEQTNNKLWQIEKDVFYLARTYAASINDSLKRVMNGAKGKASKDKMWPMRRLVLLHSLHTLRIIAGKQMVDFIHPLDSLDSMNIMKSDTKSFHKKVWSYIYNDPFALMRDSGLSAYEVLEVPLNIPETELQVILLSIPSAWQPLKTPLQKYKSYVDQDIKLHDKYTCVVNGILLLLDYLWMQSKNWLEAATSSYIKQTIKTFENIMEVFEKNNNPDLFRVYVANLFDPMSSQADTYYTRTRRAIRTIHVAPVPSVYVPPPNPKVIDWPYPKEKNSKYDCKEVLRSLSVVMRNLDGTILTIDNRRLRDVFSLIMHTLYRIDHDLKDDCIVPVDAVCNIDRVMRYYLNHIFPQERLRDLSAWQNMDLSQTTFDADIFALKYADVSMAVHHGFIPAHLVCDLVTRKHFDYYREMFQLINPIIPQIYFFFKAIIMCDNAYDILGMCREKVKADKDEINKAIDILNKTRPDLSQWPATPFFKMPGEDTVFQAVRDLITPWVLKLREHFKNPQVDSMKDDEYVHYTAARATDSVRSKDGRRVKDIMLLMCQSVMDYGMTTPVKMNKMDERLVKEFIFAKQEMDKLLEESFKTDFTLERIEFDPYTWAYQFNDFLEAYIYSDIPTINIVLTPITHKVSTDSFNPYAVGYYRALNGNDLKAYVQQQILVGLSSLRVNTVEFDGEYHTIFDSYADTSVDHLRMMCQYLLDKHAKWISKNVGKPFLEEKAIAKHIFGFYRVGIKILIQKAIDAFKKKNTTK